MQYTGAPASMLIMCPVRTWLEYPGSRPFPTYGQNKDLPTCLVYFQTDCVPIPFTKAYPVIILFAVCSQSFKPLITTALIEGDTVNGKKAA